MGQWYETGFSVINKVEEKSSRIIPTTFRVMVNSTKPFVFIDEEPFSIEEHVIKLVGEKFYTNLTCIKLMYPDDPACCLEVGPKDAKAVGYLTVVDCSEKENPKYEYDLQFFQAKLRTLKKLQLKKNQKRSLVNMVWQASRTDVKSPICGDDFEFDKDVKDMNALYKKVTYRGQKISDLFDQANRQGGDAIEKLKKTFQLSLDKDGKILPIIPAFNYMEILKPQDPTTVRHLMKSRVKEDRFGAGGSGVRTSGADDSVPFF